MTALERRPARSSITESIFPEHSRAIAAQAARSSGRIETAGAGARRARGGGALLVARFRRHGGGRTGGQRLLDYREYLDLRVEVQRQDRPDWEAANPTRLSTGEAIGVGAAVMMVVLTAWERDANLLRGKRSQGTLRLLFLDEATRLSQDNLVVLFKLCRTLELQLIIAAPEVAHGGGNTTYRLVRRVIEGREDVLVTGRRLVASAGA